MTENPWEQPQELRLSDDIGGMVIAYALVAFSGAIMGALIVGLVWWLT